MLASPGEFFGPPCCLRWLLPEHEDVLKAGLEYRVGEVEALGGAELTPEYREAQRPKSPEEEAQEELEEWEPDLPTNRPVGCVQFAWLCICQAS